MKEDVYGVIGEIMERILKEFVKSNSVVFWFIVVIIIE